MKYVDDSQPETQDKQLFGMLEDLCEIFSHLMVQVEWGFVVLAHPFGIGSCLRIVPLKTPQI